MPQATNPPLSRWLCMEMPRDYAWRCLTFLMNPSQTRNHLDWVWCCFTCWTSAWTKIRFSLFNCVSIIIYIVIWIFNFWFQQLLILRPFPQSSDAMPVDSRRHPLGERGALTAKNVEDSGYVNRTNKHGLGGSIMFGIRIWVTAGGIMRLPTQETPTLQWVEAWAIRQDLRIQGWAARRCWAAVLCCLHVAVRAIPGWEVVDSSLGHRVALTHWPDGDIVIRFSSCRLRHSSPARGKGFETIRVQLCLAMFGQDLVRLCINWSPDQFALHYGNLQYLTTFDSYM